MLMKYKPFRFLLMSVTIFGVFILSQNQISVFGWDPASTPQAYLPVVVYLSTPLPSVTPSPTAMPTSSPTATQSPPSDWLSRMNWLRSLGGLPAVVENVGWSNGDRLHAQYMVINDYIGHNEDPSKEGYTAEGNEAASTSNVMGSSSTNSTDVKAINLWMSGPFHGLGIIDPALSMTGFGSYREAGGTIEMGACLDVIRGLGSIPPSVSFPVMWPVDGGNMPFSSFNGGEWPDPLTSCPGYTEPSGPPIYLQIGDGSQVPNVTAHSFQQAGLLLDHCVFDEKNYTNPDGGAQDTGQAVLGMRDAIVLIPRDPLNPGLTYAISITNNGAVYSWSFTVTEATILFAPDSEIR